MARIMPNSAQIETNSLMNVVIKKNLNQSRNLWRDKALQKRKLQVAYFKDNEFYYAK